MHRIGRVGRAGREGVAITLAEPREHRMLKASSGTPGRRSRSRRCRRSPTCAPAGSSSPAPRCEESLLADDLERFRVVVESLADEFDVMEIALAAVKLAHEAGGAGTATRTTSRHPRRPPPPRQRRASRARPEAARSGRKRAPPRGPGDDAASSSGRAATPASARRTSSARSPARPALGGRDIGAIEIADRFSIVEVPETEADAVITALRGTTIKGKRPTIRRDRGRR